MITIRHNAIVRIHTYTGPVQICRACGTIEGHVPTCPDFPQPAPQ